MKISVKKLIDIIDQNRDELLCFGFDIDNEDDAETVDIMNDEFLSEADWLKLKESLSKIDDGEEYLSDKNKRIKIFEKAIKNGMELDDVNAELQKANLMKIYVRNYYELILYWCFRNNQINQKHIMGPKEILNIKKKCDEFVKCQKDAMNEFDKLNTFSGKITLRKLKDYVANNSIISENMDVVTKSITEDLVKRIDLVDASEYDEQDLCAAIIGFGDKNTLSSLTKKYEKTRYYYVKYIVMFIETHILELIELLNEMSDKSFDDWKNEIIGEMGSKIIPWSVKEMMSETIAANKKKFNSYDETDISEDAYKRKTRDIMTILSNIVCFEGTPLEDTYVSPMFKNSKGIPINWSGIRDIGYIFDLNKEAKQIPDKMKKKYMEMHKERKKQIEELTIESFLDYPIKVLDLASLIYEKSVGLNVCEWERTRNFKDKEKDRLQGMTSISRDVLLYIIMLVNQSIKNVKYKVSDRLVINEKRINDILVNCGFDVMKGEQIIDYLVQKSINFDAGKYADTILQLFYIVREEGDNNSLIDI